MATSSDTVFSKIRSTCSFVKENAKDVKVNEGAMDKFVDDCDLEHLKAVSEYVQQFPLKFDSVDDEVDFIAIMDILQIGSGFRKPLHRLRQRGANDTITYGMISLKISGRKLDADFLASLMVTDIRDYFDIPLDEDKQMQPGITMSQPSEVKPLAEIITRILNDVGRILRSRQLSSISQFINDTITRTPTPSAAALVSALAAAFPAYNDKATYQGQEVLLLKKAQLTVADLYRKFHEKDARFNFPDILELTVFTDNVLPCMLRALGILEYSKELAEHVDSEKVLRPGDQEVEMRAISIVASDNIVTKFRTKYASKFDAKQLEETFNAVKLDYFLWTIGKEKKYRGIPRHYTRDTMFY